jgi:hypothetical protein
MLVFIQIVVLSLIVLAAGIGMFHMKGRRKQGPSKLWAIVLVAFWGSATIAALCFKAFHPQPSTGAIQSRTN